MALLTKRLLGSRLSLLGALTALAMLIGAAPVPEETAASLEAQVKAALLYNFARFVDWPAEALASKDGTFVIAILRDRAVFEALTGLEGKEVHGHRLLVREFAHVDDGPCQVLFVAESETGSFAPESEKLRGRPVLTVGEGDPFLQAGGMIALVRVDGKFRFRVRTRQAEVARLAISSKLLKLADRTTP